MTALAQSSLLAKARARPDLVRQVVHKVQVDGLAATRQAVRSRLAGDLPLGYSAAGIAVAVGPAVSRIRTGQLIATGGAGKANHAEFQAVPGLLCAAVPDDVPSGRGLHHNHLDRAARATPGRCRSRVESGGPRAWPHRPARSRAGTRVGCAVAGIDPAEHPRKVAAASGVLALDEHGDASTGQVCPGRADAARTRY